MSGYDNNMRGTLSRNTKKTEPNHADHTGSCVIDGVDYWINAWVKERKDGSGKFFSISFKPKNPGQTSSSQQNQGGSQADDPEIPF